MAEATWQGTDREFARLQQAVARNCDCVGGMLGLSPRMCTVHLMLDNQSVLDHLLYVYRVRRVFVTREFYAFPKAEKRSAEKLEAKGVKQRNAD
jgi:hypothetical protein